MSGFLATALVAASLAACGGADPAVIERADEPGVAATVNIDTGLGFLEDREVYLPQFAGGADGTLYVVWSERGEGRGSNLFIARRGEDGVFEPQVQINDAPSTVSGGSLDEARPGVAIGANGVIAIVWTSRDADIRAAVSTDGGQSFAPSVALNSDVGARAYRGFVDVAVDAAGVAHAAWIDGRFAPQGAEEPAELYYARIEAGAVTETNLTEDQEDSICGCCRVAIDVRADDRVVIAFRNTGGGYRDIWRTEAGADRVFAAPARLGPPMWELLGCPVFGAINVGEATLWSEASTGKRRLLAATETEGDFEVVLEDTEGWSIARPPRVIASSDAAEALLLLPGRPGGIILRGAGTAWDTVARDVPAWAMSGAVVGDAVVVIGDLDGEFHSAALDIQR
jgi:hypothetical protein